MVLLSIMDFFTSDVIAIIGIVVSILIAVSSVIVSIYYLPKRLAYRKVAENISLLKVSSIADNPSAIMAERGLMENGFDNEYFKRPFESQLRQMIESHAICLIYGTYGMGKSRSIYEYLRSGDCPFKRVLVLNAMHNDELTCSFENLKKYIKKIANPNTLIYIDNLHNRKDRDGKHGLIAWKEIFSVVRHNESHIVASCLEAPTEEERRALPDIIGKETTMRIPDLDQETYKLCRAKYHNQLYSPVIGNYIDGMGNAMQNYDRNFERIIKKNPLSEGEILLLSTILLLKIYFNDRCKQPKFIQNAYEVIRDAITERCKYLGYEQQGIELQSVLQNNFHFKEVLSKLEARNILKNDRNLYVVYDQIFAEEFIKKICSDNYNYDNIHNNNKELLKLCCSTLVLERQQLTYKQEEWLSTLIIALDPNEPDMYARCVTRATPQNTRKVALFVKVLFDKKFINQPTDKKPEEISRVIGILLARIYDNWEKFLTDYIEKGIIIKDNVDLISELLRIAADKRSSKKEKEHVMDFIDATLGINAEQLNDLAKTNIRIAHNYEIVQADWSEERIKCVANLFKREFTDLNKRCQTANEQERDNIIDEIPLMTRSLLAWARIIAIKADHPDKLKQLIDILHMPDIEKVMSSLVELIKESRSYLNQFYDKIEFTFLKQLSLANIAKNIHKHYPLAYMDFYWQCLNILKDEANKQTYIINQDALKGFFYNHESSFTKSNTGALVEAETWKDAFDLFSKMREWGILDDKTSGSNDFYAKCLYCIFTKIDTKVDFDEALNFVNTLFGPTSNSNMGGKMKLFHNLMLYTPTIEDATQFMEDIGENNYTIDTINAFFLRVRQEYRTASTEYGYVRKDAELSPKEKKSKLAKLEQRKIYAIKQILEKAQWVQTHDACKWDMISSSILKSIRPDVLQTEYKTLKQTVKKGLPKSNNVILEAQQWRVQFDKKTSFEDLKKQLEKAKERLEVLYKYFTNKRSTRSPEEIELIQFFTSDSLTNLMISVGRFLPQKEVIALFSNVESKDFPSDIIKLMNEICALLRPMIQDLRIDDYFTPKLYYYEQAYNFAFYNMDGLIPEASDIEKRWNFIQHALERLAECGQPFMEDEETLSQKRRLPQNLMENMLPYCSFDDACELVIRAKELAKAEVYSAIYRPLAIKLLCNRLRKDLEDDEMQAMETLKKRIDKINDIISDPELTLYYDADITALISKANSRLRVNTDIDPFFPDLPKDIAINLPIVSDNDEVRHKTWDWYTIQKCQVPLETKSTIWLCMKKEMRLVVNNICENKPVDLYYLIELLYLYKDNNFPFLDVQKEFWSNFKAWNLERGNTKFTIPALYDFLLGYATTEQKEDLDYMRPELSVEYVHKKRV